MSLTTLVNPDSDLRYFVAPTAGESHLLSAAATSLGDTSVIGKTTGDAVPANRPIHLRQAKTTHSSQEL